VGSRELLGSPAMPPALPRLDAATRRGRVVLILLFFVSGAAGLVYEAVWNRLLVLQMGNTAYALTTILTVFMGGLALGSFVGGRFASRLRNPLAAYGWIELGIGVYATLVPWGIAALEPLMRFVYNTYFQSLAAFSFFQFLACGAVLLLPVVAMGATLPIVSDFVARRGSGVGTSVGLAYGVKTLGGFVGVMIGGLVLVPWLGLERANLSGAALSATAGIAALAISRALGAPGASRDLAPEPAAVASPAATSPFSPALLFAALAASGFAAMTYQVAWTRVITLSIGSVTYSFPLIVGGFIGGLAVGAALLGRLGDREGLATPLLVACQLGIAGVALTTIPALGDLPVRMTLEVVRYSDSFAALQLAKFGAIFAVVFAPTFLMGGMLPLAVRAVAERSGEGVGTAVGRCYASNTIGTIAGSFVAGFVLVPSIGMQRTIAAAVAVNACVGALLLVRSGLLPPLARLVGAATAAAGLSYAAFSLPAWDRTVVTSAPYLHAPLYATREDATEQDVRRSLSHKAQIVYYREDEATTVTVLDDRRSRYLFVGGKLDAISKNSTQSALGLLPMLLHPKPSRVLVVGLGSSESLAATLQFSQAREVDCVEISPAVVEAAQRFFEPGRPVVGDPRVDLRVGDGRVHMALSDERYDVIVSQPGNPWMAGASALFTREYYEELRAHLAPGGVASIWIQGFSASPESVAALIATLGSVFEHADLWETRVPGDYILTAYDAPLRFDLALLEARMRERSVADALAVHEIADPADLLGYYVAPVGALASLPGADEINRDDHNFLETRLQREILLRREKDVYLALTSARESAIARIVPSAEARARELVARLETIERSKPLVRKVREIELRADALGEAGDVVEAAALDRAAAELREQVRALDPKAIILIGG